MSVKEGEKITSLGAPLIEINPKNLDATARNPSITQMAVLHVFAIQTSKDRVKGVKEVMEGVEEQVQRKSIGYKGKAREEYGKFANLAAAGGGPLGENAAIMQPLLSESNARNAQKAHWYSRRKATQQ